MILELACPMFELGSKQYQFVGIAYNFLTNHMWAAWLVFGVIVGSAILFGRIRRITILACSAYASFVVGIVILAELIGVCYQHIILPHSLALLLESEWGAFLGMAIVAALHWLLGPRIERLLDRLTGRSHERKDRLSDIRSVDSEIPRRPKDFDPRKYFIRKPS